MSVEAMNEFRKKFESKEAISEITMKQAECECCGLNEECTEAYITQIERSHSGKWVCGLCSEAVKETMKRSPETAVKEALSSHRDFCNKYNSSTRLNPKLSFTCDMRNIAKRSCESRITNKLARSSSCVPRFDLHQYVNP
ncbi:hypothetical protein TIFTF001_009224 [Ficus carica]|uniref:DUF1677 family protein n=1 Tax=Ficus carica TaxID=3494 RepID=A0AA88AGH2_FICCA|nr:hypothetical protein TIFTF001_009224 [Ficus carica]